MKKALFLLLLTSSVIFAQDGKTQYDTYCSACHGADGKGASNGMFPPLAESEWVKGKPDRIIQTILHGLQGPIQVNGKGYDLVMPPQGAALTDEQIASISTYVRSSWGHKESAVKASQVKAQRKVSANRKEMWDSKTLIQKFPFSKKLHGFNELLSYVHNGKFNSLKELRASEADSVEEEHNGLIAVSQGGKPKETFGIVWEGWLDVPKDGVYVFLYNTTQGGALTVNGKEIINRDRNVVKGVSRARIKLNKGRANMKVEYYHNNPKRSPVLALKWQGPGVPRTNLNNVSEGAKKTAPPIVLKPTENNTIIHRNFLRDTEPRGIAVGYSEGVNLVFSADSMNLDRIWHGEFIDVGEMWENRGKSKAKLLGKRINQLGKGAPLYALPSLESPLKPSYVSSMSFKAYKTNKNNQPTFIYESDHYLFNDEIIPSSDGKSIMRTITINQNSDSKPSVPHYFRLYDKAVIRSISDKNLILTENLSVDIIKSPSSVISRGSDVLIPLSLETGNSQVIQIKYLLQ